MVLLKSKKSWIYFIILLSCGTLFYCTSNDNEPDQTTINNAQKQEVIDTCLSAFKAYYIYPAVVEKMKSYIEDQMKSGAYREINSLKALTKQLRHDLRDVSGDRHIWIDVMATIRQKSGPPSPEEIAKKRQGNFGFTTVKKIDGNIGYLKLDGFQDPAYAEETAIESINNLAGSKTVIIDLRENHGGEGKMVRLIASYFLPATTQLTSLYFRAADSTRESWTHEEVKGKRFLDEDLYILVSKNTASAAESFAYTMQNYRRAVIIGENTRGAAHWVETYPYSELGFYMEIPVARPINPVTQKSWEGTGVQPDIKVEANRALEECLRLIHH